MENKVTYRGIGFSGILTIVFVVLKLLNKITWKWIWVISPLWIDIILTFIALVIYYWLESKWR